MAKDRLGDDAAGNGDIIMVLLSKAPEKPWNEVMVKKVLKLSDDEFDMTVHGLGKWVKLEPTNNSIVAGDRSGWGRQRLLRRRRRPI
jgi:hypothetical protein